MNFDQIRRLNELSLYLPLLESIDNGTFSAKTESNQIDEGIELVQKMDELRVSVLELRNEINAINARISAIKPKKGPSPGVAKLTHRVEKIEDDLKKLRPF